MKHYSLSRLLSTALLLAVIQHTAHSQSVGIGTTTPAPSAQLDVSSTSRGLLLPRMTKAQRNAIASPANGLLVFQSGPDSVGFYYRYNGAWVWLQNATGAGSGWSTTGNSGMQFGVNYLGTRDDNPLLLGVNNRHAGSVGVRRNVNLGQESGYLMLASEGFENVAIGDSAQYATLNGFGNVSVGSYTLKSNIAGAGNTAIGSSALENTTASSNTAMGFRALRSNTTGNENVAIGARAAAMNTTGFANVSMGHEALLKNKSGNYNVAIGTLALGNDNAGSESVALGAQALLYNQNRFGNTAVGTNALYWNTYTNSTPLAAAEGLHNTALGHSALFNNRRGSGGVAIGFQALYSDTAADGTVAIGRNALYNNNGRTGNLAIGDSALFHNATGTLIEESARNNLAIGTKALFNNRSGLTNLAIGNRALQKNTTGQNNLAIGELALAENEITNASIAIGNGAMQNFKLPNLLSGNIAIGIQSLNGATSLGNIGMNNTALGMQTLYRNYDGFQNVAIGNDALRSNGSGSQNVAVGYGSMGWVSNPNSSFNTAVGVHAFNRLADQDNNTGVGAKAGIAINGSRNTILGANQASYEDNPATVRSVSGAVFLGYNAGVNEFSNNKLYIENSDANKDNTLIYGDFAADSLLLNAKTINRNLFAVRGAGANTGIELGYGVALKETNAGRIGYGLATTNTIDFYGGGSTANSRAIKFWAEGGSTFTGKLNLTTSSDNSGIELARELAGKQTDAGKIQYGGFGGSTHILNIVGGGTSSLGTDRTIKLWSEGGLFIRGATQPHADNTYALGLPTRRWTTVWAVTGAIQTSDANLKTNIQASPYGLNEVMQLNPVQYNWKEQPDGKKEVGLLAQEVLKLIPEAVVIPEDGSAMGMKYAELIPVLIKAIQEQQAALQKQQAEIDQLKKRLRR